MSQNPLLQTDSAIPKFDLIKPEHMVPGVTDALKIANENFDKLEAALENTQQPSWDNFMQPLDDIDQLVARAWGPIEHLHGVMNSDEIRAAHEMLQPEIVKYGLKISQSKKIYDALLKIQNSSSWSALSRPRQRIIERNILSMKLSGVGLSGKERETFNSNAQTLATLQTKFANNALDSTKSWSMELTNPEEVAGLPPRILAQSSQDYNRERKTNISTPEKGPWRFSLDAMSYISFIENATRRDLREKLFRARIAIASTGNLDNSPIIMEILKLRQEQAQLLNFKTFAEQSVASKMAGIVANVDKLLEELLAASWPFAQKEHAELEKFAKSKGFTENLLEWDVPYYAQRLKEEKFQYNEDELRPYFPLPKVLEGLFALVRKIFDIRVEAADGSAPVWHPDVMFFKIFDGSTQNHIASFYLDPYSRPGLKRSGAWMNDCVTRRKTSAGTSVPVAYLICNGTPPIGNEPSLMGFLEVETLFHEFGHGLQHMLTTIDDLGASGINGVEWDAVELASQFMENWIYQEPVLKSLSGHVKTKETIPSSYLEKIIAAKNFRSGSMTTRQLHMGMTDIELHHRYKLGQSETPHEVYNRISKRANVLPPRSENRALCSFSHIFAGGYSAGYYSYKWAEVLSADAFEAFEEAGLDSDETLRKIGKRYRDTILSLGGGEHPMKVFQQFRGREPSPKAYLRHNGLT